MTSHDDLLSEMDHLLQQLVSNAEQLYKESTQAISEETLMPLQNQQEELINAIVALNSSLESDNVTDSPLWEGIQEKLVIFQELNNSFINNLRVRKGLVNVEIKDVKKHQSQLSQLKAAYGKKNQSQKVFSTKKTKRINTVQ